MLFWLARRMIQHAWHHVFHISNMILKFLKCIMVIGWVNVFLISCEVTRILGVPVGVIGTLEDNICTFLNNSNSGPLQNKAVSCRKSTLQVPNALVSSNVWVSESKSDEHPWPNLSSLFHFFKGNNIIFMCKYRYSQNQGRSWHFTAQYPTCRNVNRLAEWDKRDRCFDVLQCESSVLNCHFDVQ